MSIHQAPDEIVLHIIEEVNRLPQPADRLSALRSVSLVSKRFSALAGAALYSKFYHCGRCVTDSVLFLRTLLVAGSRLSIYTKDYEVTPYDCEGCDISLDLQPLLQLFGDHKMKQSVNKHMFRTTGDLEASRRWYNALVNQGSDNSAAITGLVLSLLQNLQHLRVDCYRSHYFLYIRLGLGINSNTMCSMSNLEKVDLDFYEEQHEYTEIEDLEGIFKLPLQTISLSGLAGYSIWKIRDAKYTTTSLSVKHCDLMDDNLIDFLVCFKALQRLTYAPSAEVFKTGGLPHALYKGIAHLKHCLQFLAVCRYFVEQDPGSAQLIPSLRDFDKLSTIALPATFVMVTRNCDTNITELTVSCNNWLDLLPANLVRLDICAYEYDEHDCAELQHISQLIEHKSKYLPLLCEIYCDVEEKIDEDLDLSLSSKGIEYFDHPSQWRG